MLGASQMIFLCSAAMGLPVMESMILSAKPANGCRRLLPWDGLAGALKENKRKMEKEKGEKEKEKN